MLVLVKKTAASGDVGAAEHSEELSAISVAAEQQSLEAEAAPNRSWMELQTFLKVLPFITEIMIVAPVAAIRRAPHGGMVVQLDGKAASVILRSHIHRTHRQVSRWCTCKWAPHRLHRYLEHSLQRCC